MQHIATLTTLKQAGCFTAVLEPAIMVALALVSRCFRDLSWTIFKKGQQRQTQVNLKFKCASWFSLTNALVVANSGSQSEYFKLGFQFNPCRICRSGSASKIQRLGSGRDRGLADGSDRLDSLDFAGHHAGRQLDLSHPALHLHSSQCPGLQEVDYTKTLIEIFLR